MFNKLKKSIDSDRKKIETFNVEIDKLDTKFEVYCNKNEAVLDRIYERKNKCQVGNTIKQLREDLLAVAELV
ncbi:hypothetical protein Rin_00008350, partial [Candidatus Regiella insecticola 5.15]